jgi:nifR3 family TIM-barrel protein
MKATTVPPLLLGPLEVWPPVVLAPMAGVTNAPFRRLVRRFAGTPREGMLGGVFVCEMIGARALVEGDEKTRILASFPEDERPRSIQLYGTDPGAVGEAVALLVDEERADHVDLNFGCPAPKITRNGGGAALPFRSDLLRSIVAAAVRGARGVPVTVKFRKGIDDRIETYLDTGRIAEEEGAAAVALHARTAEQLYSGHADWKAISRLVDAVSIPVLGNGDVWRAEDARRMLSETGAAGVVVGRGCLGRPWLFRDLARVFSGLETGPDPSLGFVADVMAEHARLLTEWFGPYMGIRTFRKHTSWYVKGYPVGPDVRRALAEVEDLEGLAGVLAGLERTASPHAGTVAAPRGHTNGPRQVRLPHGYLEGRWREPVPREGERAVSGG